MYFVPSKVRYYFTKSHDILLNVFALFIASLYINIGLHNFLFIIGKQVDLILSALK